jgi:chitinase
VKRRPLITVVAASAAMLGAGVVVALHADAATLSSNWYASAPYLMPFDNSPPNPVDVMNATGQKAFQLAFILAPSGGGCTPTWDGTTAVSSDTTAATMISNIRANGGDVSVSIGGYGGTKLGQTCGTPEATAAAYQQVITKYSLKAIDFDLEEPEYENTAAVHNEIGAAKILQQNNSGLYVSVTTPGTAAGTGWFGTQMLIEAKNDGFTPANFSIMPFDGGFSGGASQVSALEAFHTLLMNTFGWSSATAYAHEGVSQMNGRSDAGEYFYQADFQTVLDYATSHGLARYTNWSVNRDRQCADPNQSTTSGTCSSVPQTAWEFTKYSARFAGATPPTSTPTTTPTTAPTGTPTTSPTTAPPTGGSCAAAAWSSATAYNGGAQVSYNGHTYTAKWWTQGETPGTADVWTDNGACSGGGTTTPPSGSCPAAWSSSTAYNGGAVVSYNGHKYTAKWWTQGETPGNHDVWTDNGTCG